MQTTTAEAELSVAMPTTTPAPAMSEKASAFTIASLMADCTGSSRAAITGGSSVSTSSAATDGDCVSASAASQQRRDVESPTTTSTQNYTSCTTLGTLRFITGVGNRSGGPGGCPTNNSTNKNFNVHIINFRERKVNKTQVEKRLHCDQLILRKISEFHATRCQMLKLNAPISISARRGSVYSVPRTS